MPDESDELNPELSPVRSTWPFGIAPIAIVTPLDGVVLPAKALW
jgi:hypothetical protein